MIVLVFLCLVFVLLIVKDVMRRRSRRWRLLCKFPGDQPLPLIGNALALGFDSDEATKNLLKMWKKHGQTSFRVSVGSEDWLLLSDPDHVGTLMNDPTILSKSPERNAAVKPFFGESVSTSEGDRWRWARKLVSPTFHVASIRQKLDVVNERSDHLLKILKEFKENDPVPLYQYIRPFMLDVLFETLMGVESNYLNNLDDSYLEESGKVINMITENFFSYWRNIRPLFGLTSMHREMMTTIQCLRDNASNVIIQRKSKVEKHANEMVNNTHLSKDDLHKIIQNKIDEDKTLIDHFLFKNLPNGERVPDDVINEEISFVYFTGHFTTATTISHALYCIAKHPEVQNRVIKEQHAIFTDDFLRKPTMKDLAEMKYLEAVINETLRIIPTVSKIGRKLQKDLLMKDGRVVPAGTTVIVFYEAMYVNEREFPEPHKFKPERFFEENKIHPHAFMPFGGGPRSCIGSRFAWMVIKATISSVLRNFEVAEGGPGVVPQFSYRIVTESKNGVTLKFKRRQFAQN